MLSFRGLGLAPALAVVGLVGFAYGVEEFVLVALAGATLFVLGALSLAWQVRRARSYLRIEVRRQPGAISVDDRVCLVIEGSNSGHRPVPALWLEGRRQWTVSYPGMSATRLASPTPSATEISEPRAWLRRSFDIGGSRDGSSVVPALGSGAIWKVPVPVPTRSRGVWTLAPVGVWCADSLGLMRWKVTSSPPGQVVVLPRPSAVGERAPGEHELRGSRHGAAAHESLVVAAAGGDEFAGIRPYEPGDRLTRLHWPTLARSGDLLTRAFVELEEQRVQLMVDARPWKVDASVSLVAGAGVSALAGGAAVELLTTSGERAVVLPGPSAPSSLLYRLALVVPSAVSGDDSSRRP